MTNKNAMSTIDKWVRGLAVAGIAGMAATLAAPAEAFFEETLAPLGVAAPPLDGKDKVDPRTAITLEATGLGAILAKAELRDSTGKVLAEAASVPRVVFNTPLAFGTRYTVKATAEREWPNQAETREFSFTTIAAPQLEGPPQRVVAPDGSVMLHFDQPVGEIQATGEVKLTAEPDETHQNIRLVAEGVSPDKTYPVQLNWQTATGVPLPPLALELSAAPPLTADANIKNLANLGLALPLVVKFSEPLADRADAGRNIQVRAADGKPVAGRWDWQGQKQLKFTPQPSWPPSSTIEVSIQPQTLKTVRGGSLEKPYATHFSTGTDRHLYVYLDAQRVDAVENGQVVRSFKVSTGKAKTPTVTGNFYIYDRYTHKTMRSDVPKGRPGWYEVEDVPYTQFFHKDYAFHGAFWHNNFGHPASHGCVNMATKDHNKRWPSAPEDAGWLYRWAALGVPVTVSKQGSATANLGGGQPSAESARDSDAAATEKPAAKAVRLAAATPDKPAAKAKVGAKTTAPRADVALAPDAGAAGATATGAEEETDSGEARETTFQP